jgi:hypothetical protein
MEIFWTIVVFAFVVATLVTVAFAIGRAFGLGQDQRQPQH